LYPSFRAVTFHQNLPGSAPGERLIGASNSLWGTLNASYSLFRNSNSVQRTITGYMSASPQVSKVSAITDYLNRSGSFPVDLRLGLSQKYFIGEKFFLGTDPFMNISLLSSDRLE